MNQTRVKIEALLKISHALTFDEQYIKGYARLKTEADISLINEFNDGLIDDLSFKIGVYRFNIGDEVNYTLSLYHTGRQFASYENFILHQMNFANNDLSDEYVIYEEEYKVAHGEKVISNLIKQAYPPLDNRNLVFTSPEAKVPTIK